MADRKARNRGSQGGFGRYDESMNRARILVGIASAAIVLCLGRFLIAQRENVPLWEQLEMTRSLKPVSTSTFISNPGPDFDPATEMIRDSDALFLVSKPLGEVEKSLEGEIAKRHMTRAAEEKRWSLAESGKSSWIRLEPCNSNKTWVKIDECINLGQPSPPLWSRIVAWVRARLP